MELKESSGANSEPSLLGEIFAMTGGGTAHDRPAAQAQVVRQLHTRLASSEFVDRMTGIFYRAKRAALTSAK